MKKFRIGLLPYLNVCPLGEGLAADGRVAITRAVPSGLAEKLEAGLLDVAMLPVVDFLKQRDRWRMAVPYGICCRGAVWTVKLFSPVPFDEIDRVTADLDSHTSVNLTRVLFHELRGEVPELAGREFSPAGPKAIVEPTLLIGDKAWQVKESAYSYDLGQLWHERFGLPFVFAMWISAGPAAKELKELLTETAERNLARTRELAEVYGPKHGFAVAEAEQYLGGAIRYRVGKEEEAGLERFSSCLANLPGGATWLA